MPWVNDIWEILLQPIYERGYLIPAVNNDTTDYVACAATLARSIREWHPNARICLLTDHVKDHPDFDLVRTLPHGDQSSSAWKLSNDWQAFLATPFRQTIKLEADMFCASDIDHWWTLFEKRDVVISQGCRDHLNNPSTSRFYRRVFDANNLPDVYSAIIYWRFSRTAQEFFDLVREIFQNWDRYRTLLRFSDDLATTDVVYAMAAQIMGPERVTLPKGLGPNIVHMKRHILGTQSENWSHELLWELTRPGLRIGTVSQRGLVHYHIKEWIHEHD